MHLQLSDLEGLQARLATLALQLPNAHFHPRYNLAPLQAVWAIYQQFGENQLVPGMWSLVPPWAKPDQFPRPLTIARAETIWERASFKPLVRRYRTLVLVNGFYLWDRKRVYYLRHADVDCLALGGLYQFNADGNLQVVLITHGAAPHPDLPRARSPVVVSAADQADWLASEDRGEIDRMIQTPVTGLIAQLAMPEVKDPRYDDPRLLTPQVTPIDEQP